VCACCSLLCYEAESWIEISKRIDHGVAVRKEKMTCVISASVTCFARSFMSLFPFFSGLPDIFDPRSREITVGVQELFSK
jgi:hypothetical protein